MFPSLLTVWVPLGRLRVEEHRNFFTRTVVNFSFGLPSLLLTLITLLVTAVCGAWSLVPDPGWRVDEGGEEPPEEGEGSEQEEEVRQEPTVRSAGPARSATFRKNEHRGGRRQPGLLQAHRRGHLVERAGRECGRQREGGEGRVHPLRDEGVQAGESVFRGELLGAVSSVGKTELDSRHSPGKRCKLGMG